MKKDPTLLFVPPKTPWWSNLLGWINRTRRQWRERKRLIANRRRLIYKGSVLGETQWVGSSTPHATLTHRWDLYEAGDGTRKVKFTRVGSSSAKKPPAEGEDHPRYSLILRWQSKQWDFSWEDLREGKLKGWNR